VVSFVVTSAVVSFAVVSVEIAVCVNVATYATSPVTLDTVGFHPLNV
jgi:hypothetical protein